MLEKAIFDSAIKAFVLDSTASIGSGAAVGMKSFLVGALRGWPGGWTSVAP
jgi:uncharacterized cupin superfamily protein